jgi:transposase
MPKTAIAVIGIDIGKNSFHVVGHDSRGAIILRQKWSRGQIEAQLANMLPCLVGMEACVKAHHLARKLTALGHTARLMPAKYVRPYAKGQKNDFTDAEAIAEAVQRPTMKFVATKTAEQLDLQALHRVRERLVSQRTGIINQIRAFMLERGIAVRPGIRFLRTELPIILASRTDVLSPRMLRVIEDLAGDWRRLDERVASLSREIETIARQDAGCDRLMSVPGIGPSSQARSSPRSAPATCSRRDATSRLGSGWHQSRCRREIAPSSARSRSGEIAICACFSCKRRGSFSSSPRAGSGTGSSRGSRPQRSGCTTTCWRSHSPISSRVSPGQCSPRDEGSKQRGRSMVRPNPHDPGAVLGTVKAKPYGRLLSGRP